MIRFIRLIRVLSKIFLRENSFNLRVSASSSSENGCPECLHREYLVELWKYRGFLALCGYETQNNKSE